MSGFWVTKLVNIFSISHCFLIPLLSDGSKIYFQEIEDDKITNFVETTETYFDESTIISIPENKLKQYHIGDGAVYAIQINPGVVSIANRQLLVKFYMEHLDDIPKDCALYEEMQFFIDGMIQKRTRMEIEQLSLLPISFFSNFKKSFNSHILWPIFYNSDPLHFMQRMSTELISLEDDLSQYLRLSESRYHVTAFSARSVYNMPELKTLWEGVYPGEVEINIERGSCTDGLFDTPNGALFSPTGFSETNNIFALREHVINDMKKSHFGNKATIIFNSKIKTKIPTSSVLMTLNDIIIPSNIFVNKSQRCQRLWTTREVSAHLSQHEVIRIKGELETNSAKLALELFPYYQEHEGNTKLIDECVIP